MFGATNIHYEMAERTRGFAYGGLGVMHRLAQQTGLVAALDEGLHLLKRHLPYHESDHVLNLAYNLLCHGECLEDLERLRNDEVYLDALGAQRKSESGHPHRPGSSANLPSGLHLRGLSHRRRGPARC